MIRLDIDKDIFILSHFGKAYER